MITIKDFSHKTGFSIRMLRYLEEVRVLIPARDENNYRMYSSAQVQSAQRIKRMQNLGIQLKEIESIQKANSGTQLKILEQALVREQEIAEIKSDSIPILKEIIDFIKNSKSGIQQYFERDKSVPKKMRTLGGEEKFHRTAYNIPILKNIYEDHLIIDANIDLIATDLLKFGEWLTDCTYVPNVFSVLRESTFVLGDNITETFVEGYEKAWKKFLPEMGFQRMEDFAREDVKQLMGPHDLIIRSSFKYLDSGVYGEIIIPYTPIYTMTQLSNKT